jgi:HSP20 family protein
MLVRWNPWNGVVKSEAARPVALWPELDGLFQEANDFLRAGFASDAAVTGPWKQSMLAPAEVDETETSLAVHVDLPGHDPKDIQVQVEGDTLTIASERKQVKEVGKKSATRTERSYGMFARSFVLPPAVDADKCEAQYQNGVLTISFPKREEAKPRAIEVKVQS